MGQGKKKKEMPCGKDMPTVRILNPHWKKLRQRNEKSWDALSSGSQSPRQRTSRAIALSFVNSAANTAPIRRHSVHNTLKADPRDDAFVSSHHGKQQANLQS